MSSPTLKSHSDRLIADAALALPEGSTLVVLLHGTTLATVLREMRPNVAFSFWTPEHFFLRTLQQFHGDAAQDRRAESGEPQGVSPRCSPGSIQLFCTADLPEAEFDSILFATHAGDSSEQAQELFQAAYQRLKVGGKLIVTTNNAKDSWVRSQLNLLFGGLDVQKFPHGVIYTGLKRQPLKKVRGFRARFGFRHGDRVLMCESRPGVFSHRRLDGGARALIKSLSMATVSDSNAPMRIIEMGSGCGAVSLAAASMFPTSRILAVDSDARAVECTLASAALNGIANVEATLSSTGEVPEPSHWDLLLGNPPYYSDYRIAELFLQTAKRSLRRGGRVHIVSKPTEWHFARMGQLFNNVVPHAFGEYVVFVAEQR